MGDTIIMGDGFIYSDNSVLDNQNVLVFGTTGSGKTLTAVVGQLLGSYSRNLVIAVSKRKIVEQFIPVFRNRGYRTYDLNFADPEESIGYDPLKFLASNRDIMTLCESIMTADPRTERSRADPYWQHSAASVLAAIISAVLIMYGEDGTMADVVSLINRLNIISDYGDYTETTLDELFRSIEEVAPDCMAVSCFKTLNTAPRTARCIVGELRTAIQTMFPEEICALFEREEKIDFESFVREKSILFITTQPGTPSETFLANLFHSQMLHQLFISAENEPTGMLPRPLHLIFDEFGIAPVGHYAKWINVFREKGISCTLLVQGLSQLVSSYGESDAIMIECACSTIIFMGTNDIATARDMALRLDTTVSDILGMKMGTMVICRRGQKPFITKRRDIMQDPEYRRIIHEYEQRIYR